MKPWNPGTAAERWKAAYYDPRVESWRRDVHKKPPEDLERMHREIQAANGDAARIDAITGNDSWTRFHCSECDAWKPAGVEFDNWDGGTVVVCFDCLNAAVTMEDQR